MKPKPIIAAEHAVNWYVGNYLENPNNALRNGEVFEGEEIIIPAWKKEIDDLSKELAGREMTHKQLLDLVKERGIHARYYNYKKYEPPYCEACEKLGINR